ncbi:putative membrane protein [Halovivax ruber XH-70]|uniref:Putative membrane protein n=1 Tax=Halovivax ruber (strain DSM 18193 / JCM 13892 / XH-70) TaxID=797302 RepID=L0I9F4_HALRX|nr:DoxX family protein [Halovivax ruber]AGB16240.1 putative membrane protein [Halovivax ruber XH-70]
MATKEVNLESTIGGFTATGQLHTLSVWFILALRLMMGLAFFQSGIEKVLAGDFSAGGYLGSRQAGPAADLFTSMAEVGWFVEFVNVAVPWGEVLIGLGLLFGAFTRLAAFWGAFMMLMFYLGNWSVDHGYINGDFAYMLVFLSVAAFGAGRILGLDAYIESYDVGGQPLIERYPALRYILG